MTKHEDHYSYPPRFMDRFAAARHLSIGLTVFDQMVKDGRLPPPRLANSRQIWDRIALETAADSLPQKDMDERTDLQKYIDAGKDPEVH